ASAPRSRRQFRDDEEDRPLRLLRFRQRLGRFATKALGEMPEVADVTPLSSVKYLKPYNYKDDDHHDGNATWTTMMNDV
ncbi:unnamed protein product, partial [Scytosiphon promiscuus]